MPTDTFATRLRRLRERAGLSCPDLARATGLNYPHLWRLEKGEREPTWATVQALARALGVSTEELRDGR